MSGPISNSDVSNFASNLGVHLENTSDIDAKGRLRVSTPHVLFDGKISFAEYEDIKYSAAVTGSATSLYIPDSSTIKLTVDPAVAGHAIKQTFQRFHHDSGVSKINSVSFTALTELGVIQRAGAFDENNGVFIQINDTEVKIILRSKASGSVVDTEILQKDWNVSKFENGDISGVKLDFTKSQTFFSDYDWGIGRIRCGFIVDGKYHIAHEFQTANNLSEVFAGTSSFPIRFELESDASGVSGSNSMYIITSSVIMEGNHENGAVPRVAVRSTDYDSSASSNVWTAMLAIRIKDTAKNTNMEVRKIMGWCADTAVNFEIALFLNPALDAPINNWTDIPCSGIEEALVLTKAHVLTNAETSCRMVWDKGTRELKKTIADFNNSRLLGFDIAGNSDILVLAVRTTSINKKFQGSIDMKETI